MRKKTGTQCSLCIVQGCGRILAHREWHESHCHAGVSCLFSGVSYLGLVVAARECHQSARGCLLCACHVPVPCVPCTPFVSHHWLIPRRLRSTIDPEGRRYRHAWSTLGRVTTTCKGHGRRA